MAGKRVYFFGSGKADGDASMRDLLGGKGANLAEMTRPAEVVILGDASSTTFAPWGVAAQGVNVRLAFPRHGLPDRVDLSAYSPEQLDSWTMHNGGTNLGFADGHAKWYPWQRIISRRHGGTLRICAPDIKP